MNEKVNRIKKVKRYSKKATLIQNCLKKSNHGNFAIETQEAGKRPGNRRRTGDVWRRLTAIASEKNKRNKNKRGVSYSGGVLCISGGKEKKFGGKKELTSRHGIIKISEEGKRAPMYALGEVIG